MPTFKSWAFAQQCYSSHPSSLSFKTLTLITPAIAPTQPPPHPDATLSRGPTPAGTAPFPGTPPISATQPPPLSPPPGPEPLFHPPSPGAANTAPFPGTDSVPIAPARPESAKTGSVPGVTGSFPEYRVVITCDNCDMRHRFVIRTLTSRLGQEKEADAEAVSQLSRCAAGHPAVLRVSGIDLSRDTVTLKCGECRRSYDLSLSTVETYRK